MYADRGVRMEAAKTLVAMSIDVMVQLGYDAHGKRRTTEIVQVQRELKGGNLRFDTLFKLDEERSTASMPVWVKTGELTRKRR